MMYKVSHGRLSGVLCVGILVGKREERGEKRGWWGLYIQLINKINYYLILPNERQTGCY